MCGIAGIASWREGPSLADAVKLMTDAISYRGPDGEGIWEDQSAGVGLGHRRLAIIDLSPTGHQPISSASGRHVMVYNGEIYNFAEIRAELDWAGKAPNWRGTSDSEVLIEAVEAWGIEGALKRCKGMFAIAIWDRSQRTLTLARDRMGEKPLYYGIDGQRLIFASELKALRAAMKERPPLDLEAVTRFFQYGYVPAPLSIYSTVRKLPQASFVTLKRATDFQQVSPIPYWSLDGDNLAERRRELSSRSDVELTDLLDAELGDAVHRQTVSDVPVGAFLSGGVDSSLVVALMKSRGKGAVRTYTIGFDDPRFDESLHARAVADHLGTDHTEMRVTARDALDLIPELPSIYDEPFADSSQLPTTLVSRLTVRHVKVALSGDGGDEMFAGYPRYWLGAGMLHRIGRIPRPARRIGAGVMELLSPGTWDSLLGPALSSERHRDLNGRRIHRLAQLLRTNGVEEFYTRLVSQFAPEEGLVQNGPPVGLLGEWPSHGRTPIESMRMRDMRHYLPDDLLVKVDRASMSASLESRAPFLDHGIVELALAMPERALVRDGSGKWVLRQVLDRYVPRHIIERPKAGFAVPLADWLRGPLREWAGELLSPERLGAEQLLDTVKIVRMWQEHLSGKFDRSTHLWNILMFQAWREHS